MKKSHAQSKDWTGWTPHLKQQWRELFYAGNSHADIGQRLGCGKGGSVTQRRVQKIAPKASPNTLNPLSEAEIAEIKRLDELGWARDKIARAIHRGGEFVFRVLGRAAEKKKPRVAVDPYKAAARLIVAEKKVAAPKPPPKPQFIAPRLQARGCCLYLIGDEKPWRQCDRPIERGSYCADHHRKCHVVFPSKQEREAA